MAQLPRGRAHALSVGLALLLALVPSLAAAEVDLTGAWHVLVHYTDDNATHPEQLRWLDRLWVFERKGGNLVWTEYPIVVFQDDESRFERTKAGYSRVLGAWEPNEAQRANIRDGLMTNTRGMKKKKLRGSDAEGWRSSSRARPGSASVITYQENWSVTSKDGLPVFVQEDVMASVRAETLEGSARFETTRIEAGGVLAGSYERDGTRHGTFRMRRSGGRLGLDRKARRERPSGRPGSGPADDEAAAD